MFISVSDEVIGPIFFSTLEMKAVWSFETFVTTYETAQRQNHDDKN
jgi:hypothetical protein